MKPLNERCPDEAVGAQDGPVEIHRVRSEGAAERPDY